MSEDHTRSPSDPDLELAFDAWREDARRIADGVDVHGTLADRIVAAAGEGRPALAPPRFARWYAAAAMLLIGVGVAGTLLSRQDAPAESPTVISRWNTLDEISDALAQDPAFEPGLGR